MRAIASASAATPAPAEPIGIHPCNSVPTDATFERGGAMIFGHLLGGRGGGSYDGQGSCCTTGGAFHGAKVVRGAGLSGFTLVCCVFTESSPFTTKISSATPSIGQ